MDMQTFGARIAQYRKDAVMTQEQMAQELGITAQAVSKWENGQSLPDITQLPRLAELFDVSIDALFGMEPAAQEEPEFTAEALPWENDPLTLHAVLYAGHTLIGRQEIAKYPQASRFTFEYEGPALNVQSLFSVSCGDVEGDVSAGGSVTCDEVGGDVSAAGSVTCDSIDGDVSAGGNIACDCIEGDAQAGGNIICDEIGGDVETGGSGLHFSFQGDDGKKTEKYVRFGDDLSAEIKKTVTDALKKVGEAFRDLGGNSEEEQG